MAEIKILKSRRIYTGLTSELTDGYVIVRHNKIREVLPVFEAKDSAFFTDDAEFYDFSDHFIMPGFFDYHTHLLSGAMLEKDGILRYTKSQEEAASLLWEKHRERRNMRWILGGAWDPVLWGDETPPAKETLDRYFSDVPVFLVNKECHGAWVNSRLLELFDITEKTPDPANGYYSRKPSGEPAGYLHEAAFSEVQNSIFSSLNDRELADYGAFSVSLANRYGITSAGDVAGVGPLREEAYKILEEEGKLTLRIHFFPLMEEGIEKIKEK